MALIANVLTGAGALPEGSVIGAAIIGIFIDLYIHRSDR